MPFRLVQEDQAGQPEEVNGKFRLVDPSELEPTKEEKVAKSLKFFGYQPSPEAIRKIRQPVGVGLKGLTKGLLGTAGELIAFPQRIAGVKKPITGLPTTEQVGDFFEKLSGEEFKPENLTEEFIDRGAEFLGSILGLGGPLKGTTLAKTMGRTILGAFAPAGASIAAEKAKLPPWAQIASTIGTSFLTHRLTGKGLRDIERGLYRNARELAADNEISATSLRNGIKNQIKNLKKGGIEQSDREALRKLNDTLGAIKDNKIKISDLMETKVKLNEARGKLFAKDLGKSGVRAARKKLKDVAGLLDKNVEKFDNPKFQTTLKQANQLHSGVAETRKMFNFIKDHPQLSGLSSLALKYLFPSLIKWGGPIAAAGQVGQFMKAMTKFPGYRKAYFDVLKNAAKEEVRGTAGALKKFNKQTEDLERKGEFRLIKE